MINITFEYQGEQKVIPCERVPRQYENVEVQGWPDGEQRTLCVQRVDHFLKPTTPAAAAWTHDIHVELVDEADLE